MWETTRNSSCATAAGCAKLAAFMLTAQIGSDAMPHTLDSQILVAARPQSFTLNPRQTAVIVVDMQNDFGAAGGMFARAGIPIDGIQAVVAPTARVLAAARAADI